MQSFNIYLCGVGGQGIGLLSEILLRAADYAGYAAKAVDTHGLAQRGGIVISQIRLGENVFTPLIPQRAADLVIALERHEALRGMQVALKDKGILMYYDTVLQPLGVRLGSEAEVSNGDISWACAFRGIVPYSVSDPELQDPRMQNIVLLGHIHRYQLIPGVQEQHLLQAMEDLLADEILTNNRQLFRSHCGPGGV